VKVDLVLDDLELFVTFHAAHSHAVDIPPRYTYVPTMLFTPLRQPTAAAARL